MYYYYTVTDDAQEHNITNDITNDITDCQQVDVEVHINLFWQLFVINEARQPSPGSLLSHGLPRGPSSLSFVFPPQSLHKAHFTPVTYAIAVMYILYQFDQISFRTILMVAHLN